MRSYIGRRLAAFLFPVVFGAQAAAASDDFPRPDTVLDRKILDQHGNVLLLRTLSSWGMVQQLTNADITTALEGAKANGFNAVTVFVGGGYFLGNGWNRYQNATGESYWSGTPWQSPLGPAWASVDHMLAEASRIGLSVHMSFCGGYGTTGAGPAWESSTNAHMYAAGVEIANRYATYENIVWHIMLDTNDTPTSTRGQRINALFDGINDAEGANRRTVRWMEPGNGASIASQGWLGTSSFNATMNGWYSYTSNSVEMIESAYAAVTGVPVGDTEPPYDGAPHYLGNRGQQLRERSYATFLEGGAYINYGHENWWTFGAPGLFSEGLSWQQVPGHNHTLQQSYVWKLIDAYVADQSWRPENGQFLKSGAGSGDTKAAAGYSSTAAIAYFPTSRPVTVDTTAIVQGSTVRLRWYDPYTGDYTTIADFEAKDTDRTVSYPPAHQDGSNDWVLVVDTSPPTPPTARPLPPDDLRVGAIGP